MNRFILFILTFFTPTGFNYMYLKQKKKGVFFLIFYFIIIGTLATNVLYKNLTPIMAISLVIATNIVVFYDCLTTRKKIKYGLKPEDNLDGVILFCKKNTIYILAIVITIISFSIVNEMVFESEIADFILTRLLRGILLVEIIFMIGKTFVYISNKDDNKIYEEIALQKANREASNKLHKTIEDKNALELLKEGYANLDKIYELSISLKNTNISTSISEILTTTTKILNFIERYPHKARQLKKFMDYYLPTTVKLISNYSHLYKQNLNGKNIDEGLLKIENVMDNIEKAFKAQLDNLFEDKTLDIVSEINVLSNILKTEGLVEE